MNTLLEQSRFDEILYTLTNISLELRVWIIKNLGKPVRSRSSFPESGKQQEEAVVELLQMSRENPDMIPLIRYEFERYENDLEMRIPEQFGNEYNMLTTKILDIGAGSGDVTLRTYEKLAQMTGKEPIILALEQSKGFIARILENMNTARIPGRELKEKNIGELEPGVYPIQADIMSTSAYELGRIDLVTANYVLDRLAQKDFFEFLKTLGPAWIQCINCIPLQYQNPDTGQSYIQSDQLVIPEGAKNLESVSQYFEITDAQQFFGNNIVKSLQDGEEKFSYAGIGMKLNSIIY